MKLKIFLIFVSVITLAGTLNAQDYSSPQFAKYGDTPEERKANVEKYNWLRDAYQLKQYDLASKYFNELLKSCPAASPNLYIMGGTIYKNKIAKAKTPIERNTYIDSLLIIHDVRDQYLGSSAERGSSYIRTEKAKDAIAYKSDDVKVVMESTKHALETSKGNVDMHLVEAYFNLLTEGYKADKIETSALLNEYDFISTIIDVDNSPQKDETKQKIDALFIQSGAATCENLELIFKPQFEANPTDEELLTKISRYLTRQECSGDFRRLVGEAFYKVNPSSAAAISIATSAQQSKDFEKAFQYYDEAINLETDNATKANFCLSAAGTALLAQDARKAADYARKSLAIDETGLAYFLLAQAQAQGLSACSGFDKQAGFWVVVDNLQRARNLLQDSPEQLENVNRSISTYSAGFPSAEEVFFRTLTPGSSYNVSCGWISGTTTVRERK